MIWRHIGDDPDYAYEIPHFVAAAQQRGGCIRSVLLNTTEWEIALEAVRRGVARVEDEGTENQAFVLVED